MNKKSRFVIQANIVETIKVVIYLAGFFFMKIVHDAKVNTAVGSEIAPPTLSDWLWWLGALLGVGLGTLAAPDLYQRAIAAKTGGI